MLKQISIFCLLLLALNVAAQYSKKPVVKFVSHAIDNNIKSKPFFKAGRFVQVDNVRYQNDTNYFSLYIINNTSQVWPLITVEGEELCDIILTQIKPDAEPYIPLLKVEDTEWVTCGNSYFNKDLGAQEYLVQHFAIPCKACGDKERVITRFDLGNSDDPFGKIKEYYFSNGFSFYFDDYVFEQYKKTWWKGRTIPLKVSPDAKRFISSEDILALDRNPALDSFYKNYTITSFEIIFLIKTGEIQKHQSVKGRISAETKDSLNKKWRDISFIILDNISAESKAHKQGNRVLVPQVYTVLAEDTGLSINFSQQGYVITKSLLNQLSNTVCFKRVHLSVGEASVESFDLEISQKYKKEKIKIPVKLVDNKIPNEVFSVIKNEDNTLIVFKNIVVETKSTNKIITIPQFDILVEQGTW